jgi:hypothetical protein
MEPETRTAAARTRSRLRGALWLACGLAVVAPGWLLVSSFLLEGTIALAAGLAPLGVFLGWRLASELLDENDAGQSALDRLRIQAGRFVPSAGVSNTAGRAGVAVGVVAGIAVLVLSSGPQRRAPAGVAVVPTGAPRAASETALPEPRPVEGPFALKVESFAQLVWPAPGTISAFYGKDDPLGIDIALSTDEDSTIVASARGTVVYAGGEGCCGYGYAVILRHDGGWTTTYAHLDYISVKQDQRVEMGDVIGYGGTSGDAEAKQLHFQVQRQGRSYDPLQVLPASQMGFPRQRPANEWCSPAPLTLDPNAVVYVAFTSANLTRYGIDSIAVTPARSRVEGSTNASAPEVGTSRLGPLSLALQIPPSGDVDYALRLTLHREEDRIAIECALAVRTATDVPQSATPRRQEPAPQVVAPELAAPPPPTPRPEPAPPAPEPTPVPVRSSPPPTPRPALIRMFPSPTPEPPGARAVASSTPARPPTPTYFPRGR